MGRGKIRPTSSPFRCDGKLKYYHRKTWDFVHRSYDSVAAEDLERVFLSTNAMGVTAAWNTKGAFFYKSILPKKFPLCIPVFRSNKSIDFDVNHCVATVASGFH
jgi:hypothetical protein